MRPRFPGGFKYLEKKKKAKPSFFRYKRVRKAAALERGLAKALEKLP